jgi:hypothetical protein
MTRTTVSLPDDLATLLAREARRRETSVSDIVRRAVETFLGASEATYLIGTRLGPDVEAQFLSLAGPKGCSAPSQQSG